MASERRKMELQVGIVSVLALLILVFGIIWGKNYRLTANQNRVSFLFENSGGLRVNDPVTVNGVNKGNVTGLTLERGRVRVEVGLSRDVQLYSDYRAYITTVELMGGKKVEILPGTRGTPLDLKNLPGPLQGTQSGGFAEMLVGVTELTAQAVHFSRRLDTTLTLVHRLLDATTVQQPLARSLQHLEKTSATLHQLVANNDELVRRTLTNVDYASGELRDMVALRRGLLDSTLLSFHRSAQRLESFSSALADVSHRLENREGSLGQLLYDDQIATRLRTTLEQVDSTALELRANLGRFLDSSNFSFISLLNF